MHNVIVSKLILTVLIPTLYVSTMSLPNTVTMQETQSEVALQDTQSDLVKKDTEDSTSLKKLTAKFTVDGKKKFVQIETYVSNQINQSSVLATHSSNLKMYRCTLRKAGRSTDVKASSTNGLNSVLCANLGSSVTLTRGTLSSDADCANAMVSTGICSMIDATDVKINTSGNSSRGLYVSNGGIIYGNKVSITTQGDYSSPLATDTSGGTIRLTNGTLKSSGKNSPCVKSSGNVIVKNVDGTAKASRIAVIDGMNTITMQNSRLTGNNGVMLYQSTKASTIDGYTLFTAKDSSLKTLLDGPMFYVTNTNAKVELTNTKLISSSGKLIQAEANSKKNWGTKGANGGKLTLRTNKQILKGTVQCDGLSSVVLRLGDDSTYQGCIDAENTGDVAIILSRSAKWILTGDSYVSGITDLDYEWGNIQSLGYNIYYDASNPINEWLNGTTTELIGGGKLLPAKEKLICLN